ncbi:MAG: GNAT family N-acetyltransferase [bacterium]
MDKNGIFLCSEKEIPELRKYIEKIWGRDYALVLNEKFLCWQFKPSRFKNSKKEILSVLLVYHKGKIVGMMGLIPFQLNVRGHTYSSVWLSHWVCDEKVRRLGYGFELLNKVYSLGFSFIGAMQVGKDVQNIYKTLGFQTLDDMPRWVLVINPEKCFPLFCECQTLIPLPEIKKFIKKYTYTEKEFIFKKNYTTVSSIDSLWDSFWKNHISKNFIGGERDSNYLKWRYFEHPVYSYKFLGAKDKKTGSWEGLIVFRLEKVRERNETVIRILELLGNTDALAFLLKEVIEFGIKQKSAFIDFYNPSQEIGKVLLKMGFPLQPLPNQGNIFFPSRFQPLEKKPYVWRSALHFRIKGKSKTIIPWKTYYVTKGDSNQDRPQFIDG